MLSFSRLFLTTVSPSSIALDLLYSSSNFLLTGLLGYTNESTFAAVTSDTFLLTSMNFCSVEFSALRI
jgi:hypothetical protein